MNLKSIKKWVFLLAMMGISLKANAICYVSNGNNSGGGSLRQNISRLNNNSNYRCLDESNYVDYRIKFNFDSNGNGSDDWSEINLNSSLSLTNTSREMIIGNNSTTVTIDARGRSPAVRCIFSVGSSVDLTIKNLNILVDAGVSEDDIICGSGAAGVDLENVTVEAGEKTNGNDNASEGGGGGSFCLVSSESDSSINIYSLRYKITKNYNDKGIEATCTTGSTDSYDEALGFEQAILFATLEWGFSNDVNTITLNSPLSLDNPDENIVIGNFSQEEPEADSYAWEYPTDVVPVVDDYGVVTIDAKI